MATQTDIKSFEGRIDQERQYAEAYLRDGSYEKLLTSVGKLLQLKGGLDEARYQMETQH